MVSMYRSTYNYSSMIVVPLRTVGTVGIMWYCGIVVSLYVVLSLGWFVE